MRKAASRTNYFMRIGLVTATKFIFCQPKQNYVVAIIISLLSGCFISTLSFWDYVAENAERGSIDKPAIPYSIQHDGQRKLRSLRDLLDMPDDAAGMFAIKPVPSSPTTKEKPPEQLEFQSRRVPDQACLSCQPNAVGVCPELEIPYLVGLKKPSTADRTMEYVEKTIFNDTVDFVRFSVNRSNTVVQNALKNATKVDKKILFDQRLAHEASVIKKYSYLPGGHWIPTDCLPRWKVAIVIPYRNRSHHLPIILNHMIPILQRQRLEFAFYIVEQANNIIFNRAMLMNVGFLEALNFTKWDCFIFHDVDHLALNDYNYYGCSGMPRHFVSGSDRWKYKLPYDNFFGAVTGLTRGQINAINGFPNVYWGWGGEDDEIWNRVKETGFEITRVKGPKGHYDVINHHHQSAPLMKERHALLKSFKPRFRLDGLSNLIYPKPIYTLNALYTNISVNIQKLKVNFKMPVVNKGVKSGAAMQNKMKQAFKAKAPPKQQVKPPPKPQAKPPPKAQEKPHPKPQPQKAKPPPKNAAGKVVKINGKAIQVHPKGN